MQAWQWIALAAGPGSYGLGYGVPWLVDKVREPFRDPAKPAGPVVDRRTYRLVQRRVARLVALEEWTRAHAGALTLCTWLRQQRHEGSRRRRARMDAALATWQRLAAEYDPRAEFHRCRHRWMGDRTMTNDHQEYPVRHVTPAQWRRERFLAAAHDPHTVLWVIDPAKNPPPLLHWSPAGDIPTDLAHRGADAAVPPTSSGQPRHQDARRARPEPAKVIPMAPTPPQSPPKTFVTVLLIALVALAGGAAIVLLTGEHQLWLGLAFLVCALGLLLVADRRLRRRAEARRHAGAPETEEQGPEQPESPDQPEADR